MPRPLVQISDGFRRHPTIIGRLGRLAIGAAHGLLLSICWVIRSGRIPFVMPVRVPESEDNKLKMLGFQRSVGLWSQSWVSLFGFVQTPTDQGFDRARVSILCSKLWRAKGLGTLFSLMLGGIPFASEATLLGDLKGLCREALQDFGMTSSQNVALKELRRIRAKAVAGREFSNYQPTEILIPALRRLGPRERGEVLQEIFDGYLWARANSRALKVLYALSLKNVLPEVTNFRSRARQVGATRAYEDYWAKMSSLFMDRQGERLSLEQLKSSVMEVVKLMKAHPHGKNGEPKMVLGGSSVNAMAAWDSDFDGWVFPVDYFYLARQELSVSPGASFIADRLDRRLVTHQNVDQERFLRLNTWFYSVQPFVLEVTPRGVFLIHYQEGLLSRLLGDEYQDAKTYILNW